MYNPTKEKIDISQKSEISILSQLKIQTQQLKEKLNDKKGYIRL